MTDETAEKALECALSYISLHGLIEERHVLLKGRLVCRDWRNHEAFSGKITTVIIMNFADMRQAARFFPRTLSLRSPWRRMEDLQVFPNLRTLQIISEFNILLYSAQEVLSQMCRDFEVEISEVPPYMISKVASVCRSVGHISSLHVIFEEEHIVKGKFTFMKDILALSNLTQLKVQTMSHNGFNFPIRSLGALSQVKSLRHLELKKVPTSQLPQCLSLGSTLTHLTRLDLALFKGVDVGHAVVETNLPPLNSQLQELAPEILHTCAVELYWGRHTPCSFALHLRSAGSAALQVYQSHVFVNIARYESTLSNAIAAITQPGSPSRYFDINMTVDVALPDEKFMINLASVTGVEQVRATLSYSCSRPGAQHRCIPLFTPLPSVQLPTTFLKLTIVDSTQQIQGPKPTLVHGLFAELPPLFPHLQNFSFYSLPNSGYQFSSMTSLSALTRLTFLFLANIEPLDRNLDLLTCLPTSLKSLFINPYETVALRPLDHLTQLDLFLARPDFSLESLYSFGAPLTGLGLAGPPCVYLDLQLLASAFPRLEELALDIAVPDVSPLSHLLCLRDVEFRVQDAEHLDASITRLVGLSTLTTLQMLMVAGVKQSVESISEIAALYQLRRLRCAFDSYSTMEILCAALPNTIVMTEPIAD